MDVTSVLQHLRDLSWESDHKLLTQFISTIEITADLDIKLVDYLACHYFLLGDFRRAEEVLDQADRLNVPPFRHDLSTIDEILLAVTRARILLRRCMDTVTATHLIEELEQVDTFDLELATLPSSANDSADREQPNRDDQVTSEETREKWIMFEQAKLFLYSDMFKCGYYTAGFVTVKQRFLLENAFESFGARNSLRAQQLDLSLIMNFLDSDPDYYEKQLTWIQALLARCPDGSAVRARALQMYGNHLRARSKAQAKRVLEECMQEYIKSSYLVGQLIIQVLLLTINVDCSDKISEYLGLARRCRDLQQFSLAKVCIDLAEKATHDMQGRWEHFERVNKLASRILSQMGDRWSIQEFKLCRCSAKAFGQLHNVTNMDMAVQMTTTVLAQELTPAQEFACLRLLHDCSRVLLRQDKAEQYGNELLGHRSVQNDYKRKSEVYNEVSLARHARIVARYRVPLSATELEKVYVLLRTQITELGKYYELDMEHQLFDSAGSKLEKLIIYLSTVELRHLQHRVSAKVEKALVFSKYRGNTNYTPQETLMNLVAQQASADNDTGIAFADANLQKVSDLPHLDNGALFQSHLLCAVSRRARLDVTKHNMDLSTLHTALQEIMRYLRRSFSYANAARASDIELMGATAQLLDTIGDLLRVDPGNEEPNLSELNGILMMIEGAVEASRSAYTSRAELQAFVESREVEAQQIRRVHYQRVADFFYKIGFMRDWWLWHERGRSQALYSRLSRFSSTDAPVDTAVRDSLQHTAQKLHKLAAKYMPADSQSMHQEILALFDSIEHMQKEVRTVVIASHFSLDGILSLVAINSSTRESTIRKTSLTIAFIEEWLLKNLKGAETRLHHDPAVLRRLQPFGAAVAELSQENDLLIFFPTFPLDRFPLHAVPAGQQDKFLGDRNMIVYAPSMMLISHCLRTSISAQESGGLVNAAFMSAFDNIEQQEKIAQSHKRISALLGCRAPISSVTIPVFKEQLETASWVHYHGHTGAPTTNPLKQNYQLIPRESIDDGKLTVAEILEHRLQRKPAVVAIACSSSVQDNNRANEQLGLTSSLILAGATAVIGTLWVTQNVTGQEYARFFYDALHHQMTNADADVRFVNLAEAHRTAVMRLKKPRRAGDGNGRFMKPSDWASFTVYGSPFFKFR